jgi:hypothetical protein
MAELTSITAGPCLCLLAIAAGCATSPAPQPAPDVAALVAYLDPGQSRSSFAGCLAGKKQQPSRSVPREGQSSQSQSPQGRSEGQSESQSDDVLVHVVPGGAVVTHMLTHPCCLEGHVVFSRRGRVATLHELLAGEPCRCECHSTIDTAIGLEVGLWTVRVEVEQPFQPTKVIAEKRLKILEPRAELPH